MQPFLLVSLSQQHVYLQDFLVDVIIGVEKQSWNASKGMYDY